MMYRNRQQNGSGIVDLVSDSRTIFLICSLCLRSNEFAPWRTNEVAPGHPLFRCTPTCSKKGKLRCSLSWPPRVPKSGHHSNAPNQMPHPYPHPTTIIQTPNFGTQCGAHIAPPMPELGAGSGAQTAVEIRWGPNRKHRLKTPAVSAF